MKTTSYLDPKWIGQAVRANLAIMLCGLAILSFVMAAVGQASPNKDSAGGALKKAVAPVAAPVPPPAEVPPLAPPPPLTPEQMPPKPPQVSWDGEQLTIQSDNSTLADILAAVRTRTGADINLPEVGASERVAARLGPGPAREVLSSLLSGSDFDYIIQASDVDPLGIQSVFLTPRIKTSTGAGSTRAVGLAAQPRPDEYHRAAESNPVPVDKPEPSETPTMATEGTASGSPSATAELPTSAAGSQSPATDAKVAASDTPSAASDPPRVQADLTPAPVTPDADTNQPKTPAQRMQDMQNLFEQRRQMIEQSRKPPPEN